MASMRMDITTVDKYGQLPTEIALDDRKRRRRHVTYGFTGGWVSPMLPPTTGHDCVDALSPSQFGVGASDAETGSIGNSGAGATL